MAFDITRKKGRVVVVGADGVDAQPASRIRERNKKLQA
jgi:hypothetical protein